MTVLIWFALVCFFFEVGADKNKATDDGAALLLVAAQEGQVEMVHSLVEVDSAGTSQAVEDCATSSLMAPQNGGSQLAP
eukprot:Skav206354  [mRNA]  locus=scaffold3448:196450:196686:- [translate_table: standard]